MSLNYLKKEKVNTVLAIDPASHSLAWCIMQQVDDQLVIIKTDKLTFIKNSTIDDKFSQIKFGITAICDLYKPDVCVIEQSVYIQNFQTSRLLSYIIGFTWGMASFTCKRVFDVSPLVWRSGVGYKNLTAKDKDALKENGQKKNIELKKKEERKRRVRVIIEQYFGADDLDLGDDDIVDAVGIAIWYWKVINNGA